MSDINWFEGFHTKPGHETTRVCGDCGEVNQISAKACPPCGHNFHKGGGVERVLSRPST